MLYILIYKQGSCGYPIYDSLVVKSLQKYKECEPNIIKDWHKTLESLKTYANFYDIMKQIKEKFATDFRTLDTFLWQEGKK